MSSITPYHYEPLGTTESIREWRDRNLGPIDDRVDELAKRARTFADMAFVERCVAADVAAGRARGATEYDVRRLLGREWTWLRVLESIAWLTAPWWGLISWDE